MEKSCGLQGPQGCRAPYRWAAQGGAAGDLSVGCVPNSSLAEQLADEVRAVKAARSDAQRESAAPSSRRAPRLSASRAADCSATTAFEAGRDGDAISRKPWLPQSSRASDADNLLAVQPRSR